MSERGVSTKRFGSIQGCIPNVQIHSCGVGDTSSLVLGRAGCPPHKKMLFMQKWDAPVFKAPPELEAQNLHDDLIKRVVGLPGDMVPICNGQTLINGKVITEPFSLRQSGNFAIRFTHSSALDAAQINSNSSMTASIGSFRETMITPEL